MPATPPRAPLPPTSATSPAEPPSVPTAPDPAEFGLPPLSTQEPPTPLLNPPPPTLVFPPCPEAPASAPRPPVVGPEPPRPPLPPLLVVVEPPPAPVVDPPLPVMARAPLAPTAAFPAPELPLAPSAPSRSRISVERPPQLAPTNPSTSHATTCLRLFRPKSEPPPAPNMRIGARCHRSARRSIVASTDPTPSETNDHPSERPRGEPDGSRVTRPHSTRGFLSASQSSSVRGQSSLRSCESERSASTLPPVWQRAQ